MALFGKSDEEKAKEDKARYDDAQRKMQEARRRQEQQAAQKAAAPKAPAASPTPPVAAAPADKAAGLGPRPPGQAVPVAATDTVVTYTVQKGDSLSKIAKEKLGDGKAWRKIYEANRAVIGDDPDMIKPGQQLRLPSAGVTAARPPGGSKI